MKGKTKDRQVQRGNGRGWYHGKSSQGRTRNFRADSPPPASGMASYDDSRALRLLWESKGGLNQDSEADTVEYIRAEQWPQDRAVRERCNFLF
jgi:hypothetical protein